MSIYMYSVFYQLKKKCNVIEIKYLCCFFIFFILGLLLTSEKHYGMSGSGKMYG